MYPIANQNTEAECTNCNNFLPKAPEAEEDCTMALSLEPGNVKAFFRRGLARKVGFLQDVVFVQCSDAVLLLFIILLLCRDAVWGPG